MIGVAIAILLLSIPGFVLGRMIDPHLGGVAKWGRAFLLGCGEVALVMLLLDIVEIAWTRFSLVSSVLIVCVIQVALMRGSRRREQEEEVDRSRWSFVSFAPFAGLIAIALGYALFATAAPLPEFDFISDWGLKGRLFYEARGIDWTYLEQAWDRSIHADYPPLLPLIYAWCATLAGEWNDRAIGLLFVFFGASVLSIVDRTLRHATLSWRLMSLIALASSAFSPWVGLAEGPLVAFATAGVLLLREAQTAVDVHRDSMLRTGAFLLGFAALTKNEGITFLIGAAVAVAIFVGWRAALQLWPGFAIAATWQILRLQHHLEGDLARGSVSERLLYRLQNPIELFNALGAYASGRPLLWIGFAIGVVVALPLMMKREKLLLSIAALQALSYLIVYLLTPHDVEWHVRTSWERIASHVTLLLLVAVVVHLLPLLSRHEESDDTSTARA